jgi:hypothetical protein
LGTLSPFGVIGSDALLGAASETEETEQSQDDDHNQNDYENAEDAPPLVASGLRASAHLARAKTEPLTPPASAAAPRFAWVSPVTCPSSVGFEYISLVDVLSEGPRPRAILADVTGNNDGYVCRRLLGDGLFHLFPNSVVGEIYFWLDNAEPQTQ